jgi:hypothetical protein
MIFPHKMVKSLKLRQDRESRTWMYVMISPRKMVSNSRAPISPVSLHSAPFRVMCMKSDSDMWIRWSCARPH